MPDTKPFNTLDLIRSFATIDDGYRSFIRESAEIGSWINSPEHRQDFIDQRLRSCDYLKMPHVVVLLFRVPGPIVIPDHVNELENWSQILYGIAWATVEAEIKREIEALLERYAPVTEPDSLS